jgi:hypothetical protein
MPAHSQRDIARGVAGTGAGSVPVWGLLAMTSPDNNEIDFHFQVL